MEQKERIIRELSENESMDVLTLAINTGIKVPEVAYILDEMREDGEVVEDEEGDWILLNT